MPERRMSRGQTPASSSRNGGRESCQRCLMGRTAFLGRKFQVSKGRRSQTMKPILAKEPSKRSYPGSQRNRILKCSI